MRWDRCTCGSELQYQLALAMHQWTFINIDVTHYRASNVFIICSRVFPRAMDLVWSGNRFLIIGSLFDRYIECSTIVLSFILSSFIYISIVSLLLHQLFKLSFVFEFLEERERERKWNSVCNFNFYYVCSRPLGYDLKSLPTSIP